MIKSKSTKLKAKRVFLAKGTCSHTFFYLLNREFGFPKEEEERAIDLLAGGILQQGYQCGMLWGASMAIGAEAYRRCENIDQATELTIKATQSIMQSFLKRTKSIECLEITSCDFSKKTGLLKLFFSGQAFSCLNLAGKWGSEAIIAAHDGLSLQLSNPPIKAQSCASEVVRKMGGTEEEIAMVAGFAGGLALQGSGCGALAAAIWMTILKLVREDGWKSTLSDPATEKILHNFYKATDYEMACSEICGRKFNTIEEHTEYINTGGCGKLISVLAGT